MTANLFVWLSVVVSGGAVVGAILSEIIVPHQRIFFLGDTGGCNGCDAKARPLTQHTNGGWYCPRCYEEIAS